MFHPICVHYLKAHRTEKTWSGFCTDETERGFKKKRKKHCISHSTALSKLLLVYSELEVFTMNHLLIHHLSIPKLTTNQFPILIWCASIQRNSTTYFSFELSCKLFPAPAVSSSQYLTFCSCFILCTCYSYFRSWSDSFQILHTTTKIPSWWPKLNKIYIHIYREIHICTKADDAEVYSLYSGSTNTLRQEKNHLKLGYSINTRQDSTYI